MNALPQSALAPPADDGLVIAGRRYRSRLLTGTGKFRDLAETARATEAAGAEIVTVAIRRMNIGQTPGEPNLLDVLPTSRYTILPNTAGCYTAADAVRTCRLARELLDGHKLVKLEGLGDEKTLCCDGGRRGPSAPSAWTSWSTRRTTRSSRAVWKRSAVSRSCRSRRRLDRASACK